MPARFAARGLALDADDLLQARIAVDASRPPPRLGPFGKPGKQDPERCCLELVEAGVVAGLGMVALVLGAVEAQPPGPRRDLGLVGDHGAPVAEAAEVLGGEEAECGRVAER